MLFLSTYLIPYLLILFLFLELIQYFITTCIFFKYIIINNAFLNYNYTDITFAFMLFHDEYVLISAFILISMLDVFIKKLSFLSSLLFLYDELSS